MPLVSVIMPVYNGERYLAEAIDSILEQTFTDFELLIVDDCSQDGSAEIIRKHEKLDARIRCLQLTENVGSAAARNAGIDQARGDIIATLDCDDVCLPQRLEKQVAFMRDHPDIGLLGTWANSVDSDLNHIYDAHVPPRHAQIVLNYFIGWSFMHSTTMIRAEFLHAVGGYDPKFRHLDDKDLYARLLENTDIRLANLQETLLLYRIHPLGKSRNLTAERRAFLRLPQLRSLEMLLQERPDEIMDRFDCLSRWQKLSWKDRRASKQDLRRLIDALISRNWVAPEDKPLLVAEMNRRLELASPRRWQQFMHWRRHRLGF